MEDYDKIKNYYWYINDKGYITASDDFRTKQHRLIMELEDGDGNVVDHINHNKLDNRKQNLRICKHMNNLWNHKIGIKNTSGVSGVNWHNQNDKWQVRIGYKGKEIYLGTYDNFDEAVEVRKEAEKKYFGKYAYKNKCE